MHYYTRNLGDYLKKAPRLTIQQHGVYTRLIDCCYDREEFPTLEQAICWIWAETDEEKKDVEFILKRLFRKEGDIYVDDCIKKDIDAFYKKKNSASESAKARWNDKDSDDRKAKAKPKKSKPKAKKVVDDKVDQVNEVIHAEETSKSTDVSTIVSKRKSKKMEDAMEVFEYWKKVMDKSDSARLNHKRQKAIFDRFDEGYTVENIKQAIDGCASSPHNMGQNDNVKRYDDIELICRNGSNLERFAGYLQKIKPRLFSSQTERNLLNTKDWGES